MLLKALRLLLSEDPLDGWLLSICKEWGIQCIPTVWQLAWALVAALMCSTIYWLVCRDRGRWEVKLNVHCAEWRPAYPRSHALQRLRPS